MIIDIALVLFAGAGFWLGYTKGIVRTLFFVVFYTIALLLTLAISPWVMDLSIRWFNADKMFALIFGTIITLVILIFLLHWMLKSVEKYLKKSKLGAYSKSFGGVIMMVVSMLVYSFLIWAIVQFGWIGTEVKTKSYSYPIIEKVPVSTQNFMAEFKPLFRRYWELMEKTMHEGNTPPAG
jgi:uncharacterized membrane protein required for colicin V production